MEKQINNYFLVIDGLVKSVDQIKSPQYEQNYKRIVLFSLMDMLSKAVYGDKFSRHRDKFANFINDFVTGSMLIKLVCNNCCLFYQRIHQLN